MRRKPRRPWARPGAAAVLAAALLSGCSSAGEYQEASLYAMDTILEFQVLTGSDSGVLDRLRQEVDRVDRLLSATNPDSQLYRLNHREDGEEAMGEELAAVLQDCLKISRETQGALNIALYPVSQAWGFLSGDYHVPSETTLEDAMAKTHWEDIQEEDGRLLLPDAMELDLGAVGKGYLTDCMVDILEEEAVESALLDLGGNVYAYGTKEDGTPWRIGIQMPFEEGLAGVLTVEDQAVVTSGTYQRYFEENGTRYHHILDGETGYPAENGLDSVTIVTDQGFLADALSTALFVLGLEEGTDFWRERYPDVGVVWITQDQTVYYTKNLEGKFAPSEGTEARPV